MFWSALIVVETDTKPGFYEALSPHLKAYIAIEPQIEKKGIRNRYASITNPCFNLTIVAQL